MLITSATYGMKNTISTNNNINARYLADTAYQEILNKLKSEKENSNHLLPITNVTDFENNNLYNFNECIYF